MTEPLLRTRSGLLHILAALYANCYLRSSQQMVVGCSRPRIRACNLAKAKPSISGIVHTNDIQSKERYILSSRLAGNLSM
jgi:hypothetical protein